MIEEIFVIAKTYPTRSSKYKELVCTAGINKKGEWFRIYPVPFNSLEEYKKFAKYTWIEAEIDRDPRDPRLESHKINTSSLKILEHIPPNKDWQLRRQLILENTRIYTNLQEIIDGAQVHNSLSMCTFKPTKLLDVELQKKEIEEYTEKDKKAFQNANRSLFDNETCEVEFNAMPQIPYRFKLKFEDDSGKESSMSIIDWEFSQLYLKYNKPEHAAEVVKDKILSLFNKDIYLFLGTMRQRHSWTSNPFTIIGVFYPPRVTRYQPTFLF